MKINLLKYTLIFFPFLLSCSNSENWNLIMTSKISGDYDCDYLSFFGSNSILYVELHIPEKLQDVSIQDKSSSEDLLFTDSDLSFNSNDTYTTRWPRDIIPTTNMHFMFCLQNKTSNIIVKKVEECFSEFDKYTYRTHFKQHPSYKLKNLAAEVNSGAFYTILTRESKKRTEIIIYPLYLNDKYDHSLLKLLMNLKEFFLAHNYYFLSQALSDFISCGINSTNMPVDFTALRKKISREIIIPKTNEI